MASSADELLTIEQVATQLQVNEQTVRNWIDAGDLDFLRIGSRRLRVQRTALEAFIGMKEYPQPEALPSVIDANRGAVADALDQVGDGIKALAAALREA